MTVLSTDGNKWLTKLDRIGELSAKNKLFVFNNIGHLICVDMLKEHYQQLDGKKAVGIDKAVGLLNHNPVMEVPISRSVFLQ